MSSKIVKGKIIKAEYSTIPQHYVQRLFIKTDENQLEVTLHSNPYSFNFFMDGDIVYLLFVDKRLVDIRRA